MDRLGGLWVNTSQKGEKYMSGALTWGEESIPIIIFKNKNKKEEKHPDLIIYHKQPKEQPKEQPADATASYKSFTPRVVEDIPF